MFMRREKGQCQNDGQWELQEDLAPSVGFWSLLLPWKPSLTPPQPLWQILPCVPTLFWSELCWVLVKIDRGFGLLLSAPTEKSAGLAPGEQGWSPWKARASHRNAMPGSHRVSVTQNRDCSCQSALRNEGRMLPKDQRGQQELGRLCLNDWNSVEEDPLVRPGKLELKE